MQRHVLALALVLVWGCSGSRVAVTHDAPAGLDGAAPDASGTAGTLGRYEAEDGVLGGGAVITGAPVRTVGDLGGEASGRQAVTLAQPGDSVSFTLAAADAGATAIVVRFSLPDAPGGGGQTGPLALTAGTEAHTFTLTSRYAWLYGSGSAGTKLYNTPAKAAMFAMSTVPTHLYDEAQLMLDAPLAAGAQLTLALPAGATQPVTVDFVEVEVVAPPLTAPAGFLSITDPSCGAVASDTQHTGHAFDGIDDAAYASMFVSGSGTNPFNPTNGSGVQEAGTMEKDTYTSAPDDALQDTAMFALADANHAALVQCIALAAGSGVWIPPGRFYVRGVVLLPDHTVIRGAGMWYAKLVAVDTAPPMAVMNGSAAGSASVSGNLRFGAGSGTATSTDVTLSDFALFGNVTQRDVVDRVIPDGVIGAFVDSTFSRLWFEHRSAGIVMNGSSAGDMLSELRVRDAFADGIDLYGTASTSTIADCDSRGTGDDGFAIWSQGSASVSTGNSLVRSHASLEWYGDGLAVYGGTNVTLTDDTATDVLAGAGLKISTEFVPTNLPPAFTMTGIAVSGVDLVRCGGTEVTIANSALLIGAMVETIAGIAIDNVRIVEPTNDAIDVRVLTNVGAITDPAPVEGLTITNTEVLGGSACGSIAAKIPGDATLTNVCACSAAGAAASPCALANPDSADFTLPAVTCAETTCATP